MMHQSEQSGPASPNFFDQFDEKKNEKNFFDQFDKEKKPTSGGLLRSSIASTLRGAANQKLSQIPAVQSIPQVPGGMNPRAGAMLVDAVGDFALNFAADTIESPAKTLVVDPAISMVTAAPNLLGAASSALRASDASRRGDIAAARELKGRAISQGIEGGVGAIGAASIAFPGLKLLSKLRSTEKAVKPSRAMEIIVKAGQEQGLSRDQVAKVIRDFSENGQSDDFLFEALGAPAEKLAQGSAGIGGSGGNKLLELVRERQSRLNDRMSRVFKDVFPEGADPSKTLDELEAVFAEQAAPLYNEAYRQPVKLTQKLTELFKRQSVVNAQKAVADVAKERGVDVTDIPLMERLAITVRDLDDQATAAFSGSKPKTTLGRDIQETRDQFNAELRKINKSYAAADDIYSGAKRGEQAFELGTKFFQPKASTRDIKAAFDKMSASEKTKFVAGVVDESQNIIDKIAVTGDATRKFEQPSVKKRINSIFGKGAAEELFKKIDVEASRAATFRMIDPSRGSPTSPRSESIKQLRTEASGPLARVAAGASKSSILDLRTLGPVRRAIGRGLLKGDQATIDEIGAILSSRGGRSLAPELAAQIAQMTGAPSTSLASQFSPQIAARFLLPPAAITNEANRISKQRK